MKSRVIVAVLAFAGLTSVPTYAQGPAPNSVKPTTSVAPPSPGALPNVDGLTAEQVQEFLGSPSDIQVRKNGITIWTYGTPNGAQNVYFKKGIASMSASAPARPASASSRNAGACGEADALVRQLRVRATGTPAFADPRMRPDPLVTFSAGTMLPVVERAGAWYQVQFGDRRYGTRVGYVHCSLVQGVVSAQP
jgi:hypothetical protein